MRSPLLPHFHRSPWFDEQVRERWFSPEVHALLSAPSQFDPAKPTRLIVFATPNGNTAAQTWGSARTEKTDWHFDLQHIAAQVRLLRTLTPQENVVLACVEAKGLSWPAWRQRHPDHAARLQALVAELRLAFPGTTPPRVALAGHSGGGSFLFGFLNGGETIPSFVESIAFLDANYAYSDAERHGEKLLAWLQAERTRRLSVVAYDDRELTLNGKKVVGPEGGTFRATERMRARLAREVTLTEQKSGPMRHITGLAGQLRLWVHDNPENQILHTALVGEWNGLLAALTDEPLRAPRRYAPWIQPAEGIPPRPASALSGSAVFRQVETLPLTEREARLVRELLTGNLPPFLRQTKPVTLQSKGHTLVCQVMPDYVAVGSDQDFIRTPLTPASAQCLADAFGMLLPTPRLCDALYQQAAVKLEPEPLTEAREAARTFVEHNKRIEVQRSGQPLGLLVAGIKKDVVLTNRLQEKPGRVAIYGWHRRNGVPIQPLTTVHHEAYVDYSHGIRLVERTGLLDGKRQDLLELLQDPGWSSLLSEEGPLIL